MGLEPLDAMYTLLCAAWLLASRNDLNPAEVMEFYNSIEQVPDGPMQ